MSSDSAPKTVDSVLAAVNAKFEAAGAVAATESDAKRESPVNLDIRDVSREQLSREAAVASGKTSPVERTKSIMNVSGTSGNVVSNTPEAGLKRVPTVTFMDKRDHVSPTGSTPATSPTVNPVIAPLARQTSHTNAGVMRGASPPPLSQTEVPVSILHGVTTGGNISSPDVNNILRSELGGPEEVERVKPTTAHTLFIVDDVLHNTDGSSRSRSNSFLQPAAPVQSVPVTTPGATIDERLQEDGNVTPTAQQLAPNIPKREAGKNIDPRLPQDDGKLHILIGATGSMGTGKIKLMVKKLLDIYGKDRVCVQVVVTSAASKFVNPQEIPPSIRVWKDSDEWDTWKVRTDPVLHIELRRWADILVVAPMTANTLSKIALGLCDNLLTSVIRAWNPMFPIFLAPSMVSASYNSTITRRHLKMIEEEMPWITVFKPTEKIVGIHGDIGLGGMMDPNEIVDKIVMKLGGYPKVEDEDEDEDEEDEDKKGDDDDDEDDDEDDDDDDDDDDDEDDDYRDGESSIVPSPVMSPVISRAT